MLPVRSAPQHRLLRALPTAPLSIPVIVLLLCVLAYAPAVVAHAVTAPEQPGSFLADPPAGWHLLGSVLAATGNAEAATPGEALRAAKRAWRDTDVRPLRTRLLFLPGTETVRLHLLAPSGRTITHTVDAPSSLAWVVEGSFAGSDAQGVVGLLDHRSGEPVVDVLELELAAPATHSATPSAPGAGIVTEDTTR